MSKRTFAIWIGIIVLVLVPVQRFFFRIDLTDDKRFTLSKATKTLLHEVDETIDADLFLQGELNSGFARLQSATEDMLREMGVYAPIDFSTTDIDEEQIPDWVHPTAVYERDSKGKASQTLVYPYLRLRYNGREQWVSLLHNNRQVSGAENLNSSVEGLEYTVIEGIRSVMQEQRKQIVFLEGHGELSEQETEDAERQLATYFDVYRGAMTREADCLEPFSAVVVAGPTERYSEQDKYILDRYVTGGGSVLWLLNGVQFSEQVLSDEGFTPILAADVNLTDLLFRYGMRVNGRLVEDAQCLTIPVDVSPDPTQPQYEAMPWVFAPVLQPTDDPLVVAVGGVSAVFCSDVDFVGKDSLQRSVLLQTTQNSKVLAAPQEVNLSEVDLSLFMEQGGKQYAVAVREEGQFRSLFENRLVPEGISGSERQYERKAGKQVLVAAPSVIRNERQNGAALPMGYDRYSRQQFGNRDFILNSVLWLTDDMGLTQLRQKRLPIRLLSKSRIENSLYVAQALSICVPVLIMGLLAIGMVFARKKLRGER